MISKIISTLCVSVLALMTVSCQKSDTDKLVDIREKVVEQLATIKNESSADKVAEKLPALLEEAEKIESSLTRQDKEKMFAMVFQGNKKISKISRRSEELKQELFDKDYYGSYKLRTVMSGIRLY